MRNRERERDSSLEVYFSKNSVIVYCAFRFASWLSQRLFIIRGASSDLRSFAFINVMMVLEPRRRGKEREREKEGGMVLIVTP